MIIVKRVAFLLFLFIVSLSACNGLQPAPTIAPLPTKTLISTPTESLESKTLSCIPNATYDPIADSDLIVFGWIEGWQGTHSEPTNQLETIYPRIDIRQVIKGENVPNKLSFADNDSLVYGPKLQWGGTKDSCGAFDFDPTSYYVILGLKRDNDGAYYSSRSGVFFIGKEIKENDSFLQAVNQLSVSFPLAASTLMPMAIPTFTPLPGPCSTPAPNELNDFIKRSITIEDNGKTFVTHVTQRFWIYLDDRIYPLRDLLNSIPEGLIGYISNGSIRGPQCYPIMFEAVREGKGLLQIKDFQLSIIVDNNMPMSPLPLH